MERGYHVLAYDKNQEVLERLCSLGAERAASIRDVADRAEIVLTWLPNPAVSKAVALDDGGVKDGSKVKLYVDTSTIGGDTSVALSRALAAKGI